MQRAIITDKFRGNQLTEMNTNQIFIGDREFLMFRNPLNQKWTVVGVREQVSIEPSVYRNDIIEELEIYINNLVK